MGSAEPRRPAPAILALALLGLSGTGLRAQSFSCSLNPPTAEDDVLAAAANATTVLDVLANDVDLDGDVLVIESVHAAGVPGTVQKTADEKLLFTPAPGFQGHTSFDYTAADPSGATDRATVDLLVGAADEPPVAQPDLFSSGLQEDGGPYTLSVLGNDFDPDGGPLAVSGVPGSPGGVTAHTAGAVRFTPLPDFSGSAGFEYTVQDDEGDTGTAQVYVYVEPVNDPPAAEISGVECSGLTCSFDGTGSSDVEDGRPGIYAWDFGDGAPAGEDSTVTHRYAATGSYAVQLTVTDSGGAVRAASGHALAAAFSIDCTDLDCTFDAGPVHAPGGITGYTWDFGDGVTDDLAGAVARHRFPDGGGYTVRLTIQDDRGNATTAERTVEVEDDLSLLLLIILD